ncbi:MAG: TRAP transporter small permease [Rhodobacteraceae bacterium]|mgnify:CR=1 FL=1|jgi:TRAP-type C4-dicarboxylate transport system permease small subunit|nr:TRAP transporter small permease [Paracoccaceae bacterium]
MSRPANWYRLVLWYLDRVLGAVCGAFLIAVTFVIFLNAVGRYTVSTSFLGGQELARLLTVWLTFLAAYPMVRSDGHVTIDLALRAVPPGVQRLFRGLIGLLGMVTMIYLAVVSWRLAAFSLAAGQTGTTLPVPRALFFFPVVIGSVLMTIAFAEKVLAAVFNRLPALQALDATTDDGTG